MTTTRKRVSVRQTELLLEFMEGHRDLAMGRLRSKEANALSSRLWAECADRLNAENDGDQRTTKQWHKWYNDYKSRLLNRVRQIKAHQRGTGGGPAVPQLTPIEGRFAALLDAGRDVAGRSGTPLLEVQISPISPVPQPNSPLPATCTLPVLSPSAAENIYIYEEVQPSTSNNTESEPEAPSGGLRRRRSQRSNRRSPLRDELEASRNSLAAIESSRIEVERMMAAACNKMADAMNRMADAAARTADAQCRIADALMKLNSTLENRNVRQNTESPEY